jgi:hypothetical protein
MKSMKTAASKKPTHEEMAISLVVTAIVAGHVVKAFGPEGDYTVGPYPKAVGDPAFALFGYGVRVREPYRAREDSAQEVARMFVSSCVGATRAREAAREALKATQPAPRKPRRARSSNGSTPSWTVVATDAQGHVKERVWRLPGISPWAGHAVWDQGHAAHGRERYEIYARCDPGRGRDSYLCTGVGFATQRELLAWMAANPPRTEYRPRVPSSLTEALTSGYRPFGRIRQLRVNVVNRAGDVREVQLTSAEWGDVIEHSAYARCWAAEQCGGDRIEGSTLRPILSAHVAARGHVWVTVQ